MAYGTTLTPVVTTRAGIAAPSTAAASQMGFTNQEAEILYVANGSASPITVTLKSALTFEGGTVTVPDKAVTVPANSVRLIGPFPKALYTFASDGMVHLDFSAVTSVTVGVIDMGSM